MLHECSALCDCDRLPQRHVCARRECQDAADPRPDADNRRHILPNCDAFRCEAAARTRAFARDGGSHPDRSASLSREQAARAPAGAARAPGDCVALCARPAYDCVRETHGAAPGASSRAGKSASWPFAAVRKRAVLELAHHRVVKWNTLKARHFLCALRSRFIACSDRACGCG